MYRFLSYLLISFTVLSCSSKKALQTDVKGMSEETNDAYFIGDYILRAKADIITNAMPSTDETVRHPYMIVELTEEQGQNIQDILGLSSVSIKVGGKRTDYVLTEMLDFGSDSPTLQAVVRGIEYSNADEVTLYFFDFNSETTHHIIIKKVDSTVAY
ncbi:MAG: hypothetical protein R2809_10330 [Flavobacteriales bacterium]